MAFGRRQLFKTLAAAGAKTPASAQKETLKPALDRRRTQLKPLREIEIDDPVMPTWPPIKSWINR
jgi:hypothetical protein